MTLRELLNADAVRRIAHPLRANTPRLYAALNSIRKKLLAGGADVEAYQANALARFCALARVDGARILEVGADLELRALRYLLERGAREAVAANNWETFWAKQPGDELKEIDGARLINADATALPLADASFDYIFSVATFEHLLDLPRALEEMHRVLKPGGLLYSNFGPIWSAGKGHHLSIEVDGVELRHYLPEHNPLPDYSHLLFEPAEMRAALRGRVLEQHIDAIVEWVYQDDSINRLFHHQYLDAFEASPFRVVSCRPERDPVSPQLARILELKYPAEAHFDVTNTEVVLAKD